MCAGSEAEIRGKKVSLYMGYYGGNISIGDIKYDVDKKGARLAEKSLYHAWRDLKNMNWRY